MRTAGSLGNRDTCEVDSGVLVVNYQVTELFPSRIVTLQITG